MPEIVISLAAAPARKIYTRSPHGRYLRTQRLTILVSAKQRRTSYNTRVLAYGSHEAFELSEGPRGSKKSKNIKI
jgi:hypothetical protein